MCPKDNLRVECAARNTSIIQWSSSVFKSASFALCRRGDPSTQNITRDGIGIDVETHYSNSTFLLWCNIEMKASELLIDQQLLFTCLNVDIGISRNSTLKVLEKCQYPTSSYVNTTTNKSNSMTVHTKSWTTSTSESYNIFYHSCIIKYSVTVSTVHVALILFRIVTLIIDCSMLQIMCHIQIM